MKVHQINAGDVVVEGIHTELPDHVHAPLLLARRVVPMRAPGVQMPRVIRQRPNRLVEFHAVEVVADVLPPPLGRRQLSWPVVLPQNRVLPGRLLSSWLSLQRGA